MVVAWKIKIACFAHRFVNLANNISFLHVFFCFLHSKDLDTPTQLGPFFLLYFCRLPYFCCYFPSFSLVPRPQLSFEAQLVAGKSHDFGPISCPEQPDPPAALSGISFGKQKHEAELKYPQRIRRLNIFPANKTEVVYWNKMLESVY